MKALPFNEKQLLYIQRALRVSRQEVIDTISFSKITAEKIIECLKRKKTGKPIEQAVYFPQPSSQLDIQNPQ